MKKIYFLLIVTALIAAPFWSISQNMVQNADLEQWDNASTPTDWDLYDNISQESTVIHSGTYSAAQMSDASSQKFRQDLDNVSPGTEYTIEYWYFDNDPAARTRIWSYWMDASGTYLDANADELRPSTYSEDNTSWQHYIVTLTAPVNAAQFRFEVRTYKENNNTGGHVYFDDFNFSGQTSNDPEPSNYPTNFAAAANGLTIDLTWTDATGAQLPSGYLILGAKDGSSTSAPQDGTPVADDFDWSDGTAAANVSYGVQTFTFSGLDVFTTYTFTIYPYTNGGENIDYKTDGTAPTASATTPDITILSDVDFEDGTFGDWTPHNVTGDQAWESYTYNDNTFAKMSGYDGGPHANEDWLISPMMNLATYQSVTFNFSSATKYDGNHLQLFYSTDYDGSGDPNDFTWTEITDQAQWSDGNYSWVESGDVSLNNYLADNFYLAFKYTSGDDKCATWEVDDILIYGVNGVGITTHNTSKLEFYPNPVNDNVVINAENEGVLSVYSLTGQLQKRVNVNKGENVVSLNNLAKGLYLLQLKDGKGDIYTSKVSVK